MREKNPSLDHQSNASSAEAAVNSAPGAQERPETWESWGEAERQAYEAAEEEQREEYALYLQLHKLLPKSAVSILVDYDTAKNNGWCHELEVRRHRLLRWFPQLADAIDVCLDENRTAVLWPPEDP